MSHSTFPAIFRFLTLMIFSIDAQYQLNSSRYCLVNGKRGRCVRVSSCPLVATILQRSHEQTTSYLRENYCGFDGSKQLVCCISEYQLSQTEPTRIPIDNSSRNCQVNGQQGICLDVNDCALVKILLQRSRERAKSYLIQNQCSFNDSKPLVCCFGAKTYIATLLGVTAKNSNTGGTENSSSQDGSVPTIDVSSNPYLPNVCGRDLSLKISRNDSANLGEFPWIVLLEYQKPNSTVTRTLCSGILISRRYILTAANCIVNAIWFNWELTSVRLGEHNTHTEIDCDKDGQGNVQCADRPISVGIEEKIVHEDYWPTDRVHRNDIALLRLNHDVPFTKFIRPICLPNTSFVNDELYVGGWRKKFSFSYVKLKTSLLLMDKMKCQKLYKVVDISLGEGQICAGNQASGDDACRGDISGNPLMSSEKLSDGTNRWTAVGIVSFGPTCSSNYKLPDVYTKVSQYVPWILSNIRA